MEETLPSEVVLRIKTNWQTWQPVLLSAHAEEELGRNAIPQALAAHLGARLGWDVDDGVVQANVVNHTGAGGFARLARPALFAGVITAGQNYLLVDDFIGQGGTLANMRGFVESNGGLWWEPLP